jgi:asparagine synthase (glutamine-hydrolysing)
MCGITGFWSFNNYFTGHSLDETVQEMANQLITRGPDSYGTWCQRDVQLAFGHRRLSIVDLTPTGHQPMVSNSGRFTITYNGEVYNAPELQRELLAKGYSFRGHSDTEVILAACEAYGLEEATKKLIGMFAFALWDEQDQKLHLVRDRLGIKPLYWGFNNDILFFGSQVKSFSPHPFWQPEINRDILPIYFRFCYIPGPDSIYKGIQKLQPGRIVTIQAKDKVSIKAYWTMEDAIRRGRERKIIQSPSERVEQLNDLLLDAVQRCMVSDVPIGAFLSGGIDSSLVVALMQVQSSNPVQTFSIGFDEPGYNEAPYAKAIADHLGTKHHELYLKFTDALDIVPTIPEWCDEPFADSSQIPTFIVSRLAQSHLKVCLSGDGGDEFFAGYSRYFQANKLWNSISFIPLLLRKIIASGIQSLTPSQLNVLGKLIPGNTSSTSDRAYRLASLLKSVNRQDLYFTLNSLWEEPAKLIEGVNYSDGVLSGKSNFGGLAYIEEMEFIDSLTYLPDDILSKVDYASMAVSLESRVPLLDHRVVEYSWSLPLDLKVRNGEGKWILREVLKKYIPESLTNRPKMGFGVPIDGWLRDPLKDWAEELLSQKSLKESGLNVAMIRQRWDEHLSGTQNWHYSLWPVLMYQAWCQHK